MKLMSTIAVIVVATAGALPASQRTEAGPLSSVGSPVSTTTEPITPGDVVVDISDVPLTRFKGITMHAGRQSRVPISAYYKTKVNIGETLELRTRCEGRGDTGMIVHINSPVVVNPETTPSVNRNANLSVSDTIALGAEQTFYNDNHGNAGGNGKGSYLCVTCRTTPRVGDATVYVFSQRRETAYCALERKQGDRWLSLTQPAFRHYGGTLMDMGPLHKGDYVEVKTRDLGNLPSFNGSDYDTEMLLFNPANANRPLLFSDDTNGSRDPKISVPRNAWKNGPNYLLIGKSAPHRGNNKGVEVNVDVIRGPLNANFTSHQFGTSQRLAAGRYYVWLYAKTTSPVGSTASFSHPASKMREAPNNSFSCPIDWPQSQTIDEDRYRGALNGHAFDFRVVAVEGNRLRQIKRRKIWKGQMGAKAGDYNLFLLEVELLKTTRIAMEVQTVVQDVAFFPEWRIMRNPDASELTVATFNTLYSNGSPHFAKTLNAADLLATRGDILPADGAIVEEPDQKYWQWDADIIGLQELRDGKDDDRSEDFYADEFARETARRGSRTFNYVRGQDEDYIDLFATDGRGPLYISEHLWPGGVSTNIFVQRALLEAADCRTHDLPSEYECSLKGAGTGRANFAIPGRVTAARHGVPDARGKVQKDRPIMVVNLHLRDGSGAYLRRDRQLDDLIKKLKIFLKAFPWAFNSQGKAQAHHHQNRIILLGDFNMSAHHCGEHYWMLNKLRKAFGYAMDVSMATDNDMHDILGAMGANGVPQGWQSAKSWKNNPAANRNFPWWMTTHSGTSRNGRGRNERYDGIFLVGKGWAYDDPVREYEVMWDRGGRNVMTGSRRGGVEMSMKRNLVRNSGYRPRYPLGCISVSGGSGCYETMDGQTSPGSTALDSDHVPVRTKLRIFMR